MINIQTAFIAFACKIPSCFLSFRRKYHKRNRTLICSCFWVTSWPDNAYTNVGFVHSCGKLFAWESVFKKYLQLAPRQRHRRYRWQKDCFSKQNPLWMAANVFLCAQRFCSAIHWPSLEYVIFSLTKYLPSMINAGSFIQFLKTKCWIL